MVGNFLIDSKRIQGGKEGVEEGVEEFRGGEEIKKVQELGKA